MPLIDSSLNLLKKGADFTGAESDEKLRSTASIVINVFALFLAINTWYAGNLSSTITTNTILASDVWNFYQAKSIKQTLYELAAVHEADASLKKHYLDTVKRYESDPISGEGRRELTAKAKALEEERNIARIKSPWISYAGTAYQLSIVLLSASILRANKCLFAVSFMVAAVGLALSAIGVIQ